MEGPLYGNDCSECTFLGRWDVFDLYVCENGGVPEVLSRYGEKVRRGLGSDLPEELEVAQRVAVSRKLITPEEVAGADFDLTELENRVNAFRVDFVVLDEIGEKPARASQVRQMVKHSNPSIRAGVARRQDLTPDEIHILATDPEPRVRFQISHRFELESELVWLIAHDPDELVRSGYGFYQHSFPAELGSILKVPFTKYLDTENPELVQEVLSFPAWKRSSTFVPGERVRSFQKLEDSGFDTNWFSAWKTNGEESWQVMGETGRRMDGSRKLFSGRLQLPLGTDGAIRIVDIRQGISAIGLVQVSGKRIRWGVSMEDSTTCKPPPFVLPSESSIPEKRDVELAGHMIFKCSKMTPTVIALWSSGGEIVGASLQRRAMDTPNICEVSEIEFLGGMWDKTFQELKDNIRKFAGRGLQL